MNKKSLTRIFALLLAIFASSSRLECYTAEIPTQYLSLDLSAIQSYLGDYNFVSSENITKHYKEVTFDVEEPVLISETYGFSEESVFDIKGDVNWFEEAQYLFPRETDAVITDVETGKSFHVRRTYGTNHADIEALTKEDTRVIKEIWGGFSWERRAVTVQAGSVILAASMAAMPHAGLDDKPALQVVSGRSGGYGRGQNLDSVKDNGMDGHMDLHFAGSKTHSTNRVDRKHQNMVAKAEHYILEHY